MPRRASPLMVDEMSDVTMQISTMLPRNGGETPAVDDDIVGMVILVQMLCCLAADDQACENANKKPLEIILGKVFHYDVLVLRLNMHVSE